MASREQNQRGPQVPDLLHPLQDGSQWPLPNQIPLRSSENTQIPSKSSEQDPFTMLDVPAQRGNEQPGEWHEHHDSLAAPGADPFRPISHASTSSNYSVQEESLASLLPYVVQTQARPQSDSQLQALPEASAQSESEARSRSRSQSQPQPQVPSITQKPGRRAPLGPPPSARRGPSSYYSQRPCVSPIIEERDSICSPKRAHRESYASSNVTSIAVPEYYMKDRQSLSDDHESAFDQGGEETPDGDFAGIPEQEEVEDDHVVPVRQASFGKRSRPTLTTIQNNDKLKTGDRSSRDRSMKTTMLDSSPASEYDNILSAPASRSAAGGPTPKSRAKGSSRGAPGKQDGPSDVERALNQPQLTELSSRARGQSKSSYLVSIPFDTTAAKAIKHEPEQSLISGSPNAAAMDEKVSSKQGSLAQRIGSRRPPRLDIDAVAAAEARGSLTSLPDLLRRATRLASNLDRGRTASKLGTDWIVEELLEPQEPQASENRRSRNSLLDILSYFPPPRAPSPGAKELKDMDMDLHYSSTPSEIDQDDSRQTQRRCCGMPFGSFLILLGGVLLITIAAIIIPIALVYLPKEQRSHSASAALASCQKSLTCENGGASIVESSGSCGCLCVNGYTGSTCSTKSTASCVTGDIGGISEATVGSAIPRLLTASSNFSVPLNSAIILSLFTSNDLSCASENALVTFNGLATRSISLRREQPPASVLHDDTKPAALVASVVTRSEGIPFDQRSSHAPAARSLESTNSTTLDFARVAVLFVMQDSGALDNAVTAQENLQDYFTSDTTSAGVTIDATNVTLAAGYYANLQDYIITTANGTSIG